MKSIVITGAASGIGLAVAQMMLEDGWLVGMFDVNEAPLLALQQKWGAERCSVHVVSVTDETPLADAFASFHDKAGRLDVLFNCAGLLEFGHFEEVPLSRHQQILAVNSQGLMHCCHLAFPYLQQQAGARVINMSSASSMYGVPGLGVYAASKAWVKSFTEALNIEWARHDIHVLDVEPPFVDTNMVAGQQAHVMGKMGVNLSALDIAKKVRKSLASNHTHVRVSLSYKIQYFFHSLSITPIRKQVMKYLTGY
ncbi:MAG: SDR family oxidoreductase [Bermanella sp.]